jgi:hypothetical protein
VRLVWVPEGAAPGEELSVVIEDKKIMIKESVKPGKRPGNPNGASQGMAQDISGAIGSSGDDN